MAENQNASRLVPTNQNIRDVILPKFPELPTGIVTGNPEERQRLVAEYNRAVVECRRQEQIILNQWLRTSKDI